MILLSNPLMLYWYLSLHILPKQKGVCNFIVHVERLNCGDKFFITQTEMHDVYIILGRTWQNKYNCSFNWKKNLVHCQSKKDQLWIPLHTTNMSTQEFEQGLIASKTKLGSTSNAQSPQVQPSNDQDLSTNHTLKRVCCRKEKHGRTNMRIKKDTKVWSKARTEQENRRQGLKIKDPKFSANYPNLFWPTGL